MERSTRELMPRNPKVGRLEIEDMPQAVIVLAQEGQQGQVDLWDCSHVGGCVCVGVEL